MATPGTRIKVKPPERGVFALDHDGECKNEMKVCSDSLLSPYYDNLFFLEIFGLFEIARSRPFSMQSSL
jgi:hypothetical protein